MNYEEMNKGCFEEAKRLYKTANADQRCVLEKLFPELEGSDDEKVREELIIHLKQGAEGYEPAGGGSDYQRWLAWVEKQDVKPIKFNNSDMIDSNLNDYCCKIYNALDKENGGVLSFARLQHLAMDIYGWCNERLQDDQIDFANKEYWRGYIEGKKEMLDKYAEAEKQGEQEKDILEDAILDGYILDDDEDGLIAETIRYKHEKQGGQKPAWGEANEIDKEILNAAILFAMNSIDEFACNGVSKEDVIDWLKSLKDRVQPKQEWNEEDSYYRNHIIQIIEEINNAPLKRGEDWEAYINWLKSLKPQNQWKPSEEQMEELEDVIESNCFHTLILQELLEQLKKLKEE